MKIILSERELRSSMELNKGIAIETNAIDKLTKENVGNIDLSKYDKLFKSDFKFGRYKNQVSIEKRISRELKNIYIFTINEDLVLDSIHLWGGIVFPLFDACKALIKHYIAFLKPELESFKRKWN